LTEPHTPLNNADYVGGFFIVLFALKLKARHSTISNTMLQNLIAIWYNNTRRKGFKDGGYFHMEGGGAYEAFNRI
jgi:hypothetical protein